MKFLRIGKDEKLFSVLRGEGRGYSSVILVRPVQSGKTSVFLETADSFYREYSMIAIMDKSTPLAQQTYDRAKKLGWTIVTYEPGMKIARMLKENFGSKFMLCFMMEINNMKTLIAYLEETSRKIMLFVDEGDKSKSTKDAKEEELEEDDELNEEELEIRRRASKEELPPITKMTLIAKNEVTRLGGVSVLISATPFSILASEKDNWLVVFQDPYLNYTGAWLDHPARIRIEPCIPQKGCKVRERWSGTYPDRFNNNYREAVYRSCTAFKNAKTNEPSIMQLMLISLEQFNVQQSLMATECERLFSELGSSIPVMVFNGETKDGKMLSEMVKDYALKGHKKLVVIAGYCAARGVSFTDFSDPDNKFELIIQVHASKLSQNLASITQAMRIFGPARRTVNSALLVCNMKLADDVKVNMVEQYRIVRELAEGNINVVLGNLDPACRLGPDACLRYIKQREGYSRKFSRCDDVMFQISDNPEDHLPFLSDNCLV